MNWSVSFSILIIYLSVILLVLILSSWKIHIEMTKESTDRHGWANFDIFKKEFDKYKWDFDSIYKGSVFNRQKGCQFHAKIIKFNDIGMIMKTPWDWRKANKYLSNYIKENKLQGQEELYDWSEV